MAKSGTLSKSKPKVDTLAMRDKPPADLTFEELSRTLFEANDVIGAAELAATLPELASMTVLDSKEKGRLVGVPFFLLNWRQNEGDFGSFWSLIIVTKADEKLVLNDGSTGIGAQMDAIAESGNTKAIYVKKGLRVSKYEYEDPKTHERKPAATYYLDMSA
jgi:hypothetical protein